MFSVIHVQFRNFRRTTATGEYLKKGLLKVYLDKSVKKRGVSTVVIITYSYIFLFQTDDFLHCDSCSILNTELKRVTAMMRVASVKKPSSGRLSKHRYTAAAYRHRVISRRKRILFRLIGRYGTTKYLSEVSKRTGIDVASLTPSQCVPDADVAIGRYVDILNTCIDAGEITEADVLEQELIELDDEGIEKYVDGRLHETDLTEPVNEDDLDIDDEVAHIPEDDNHSLDGEDGIEYEQDACRLLREQFADIMRLGDPDARMRRRMNILSCAERIMALRRFHNEHVTWVSLTYLLSNLIVCSAERILAYTAFEMSALHPHAFMVIATDGISKDKTKVCSSSTYFAHTTYTSAPTESHSRKTGRSLCRMSC